MAHSNIPLPRNGDNYDIIDFAEEKYVTDANLKQNLKDGTTELVFYIMFKGKVGPFWISELSLPKQWIGIDGFSKVIQKKLKGANGQHFRAHLNERRIIHGILNVSLSIDEDLANLQSAEEVNLFDYLLTIYMGWNTVDVVTLHSFVQKCNQVLAHQKNEFDVCYI